MTYYFVLSKSSLWLLVYHKHIQQDAFCHLSHDVNGRTNCSVFFVLIALYSGTKEVDCWPWLTVNAGINNKDSIKGNKNTCSIQTEIE